jgi:hypothetical protein
MRTIFGIGLVTALARCGASADRALSGTAPEGASDIYAIDSQGRTSHADSATGAFTVALEPGASVILYVALADGTVAPLVFDSNRSGGRQSVIPDFEGRIELGQLTIVDRSTQRDGEGSEEANSEDNPLEDVDSDDDGESDVDDDDDDNDGQGDADDDDADGDGHDDDEADQDCDDDGSPDEADSDDDDDGVEDADDDGGCEDGEDDTDAEESEDTGEVED